MQQQIFQRRLLLLLVCLLFPSLFISYYLLVHEKSNGIGHFIASLSDSGRNQNLSKNQIFWDESKTGFEEENSRELIVQRLTKDLQFKLGKVLPSDELAVQDSCIEPSSRNNSCDKTGCRQLTLPKSPQLRIEQLVEPPYLHLSVKYMEILKGMRESVTGFYDIIITTGASSNHFKESKALVYNLQKYVFPYLKNFTFIYYNLGLSKAQREDISKICRCHLRDFPFSLFPETFSYLRCYAWKPMIVNAHVPSCNLLQWVDASIRFVDNSTRIRQLYRLARSYGLVVGETKAKISAHTLKSMFHFFGDEACAFQSYSEIACAAFVLSNEPLIRSAILIPWAACALNESCMCPHKKVNIGKVLICPRMHKDNVYGLCHRFDQSALGIIARKIFQEKSHHVMRSDFEKFYVINRGDTHLLEHR